MRKTETITAISEVLAAISIVASGVTFLYQSWWMDYQVELKAVVAGSTPHVISILTTNSGGKDLVITSATITSKALAGSIAPMSLKINPAGELIKKGESLLLVPSPSNLSSVVKVKDDDISDPTMSKTLCVVRIEYVDPNGVTHMVNTPFACYAGCAVDPPLDNEDSPGSALK